MSLFLIFLSSFFVNNIVLIRFIGLCPLFGASKKMSSAVGMSMWVTLVTVISSWVTWTIYKFLLVPLGVVYLRTLAFILVIVALAQLFEIFFRRFMPALYTALGVYLPLITTNCIILGATLLIIDYRYNFLQATIFAFGIALGFTLAIVILAGIREKLELAQIPDALKGAPIAFITASLISLAFLGFIGFLGISR